MVVAQLVEQSHSIPEVRSLNPVIGKNLYWTFTVNSIEKTKIKEKEAGNGPIKKGIIIIEFGKVYTASIRFICIYSPSCVR